MLALAIRGVLDRGQTVALGGAEQLNSVHDAFGRKLSSQDLADIDAILTKYVTSPVAPEFMAPPLRDLSGEGEKR
ncbi:hypothetical protein [Pandoraea apista]|uniref:hypothetical protein n=1 Tax=Pandoraea apista TaxID=93218 RepID=UPI00248D6C1A|nr:hypothetical protein [Pandoraea apista]